MTNRKGYRTSQRELIIDFFRNRENQCFTAKEIIGEAGLLLGDATIYRNLSKLASDNVLRKFTFDQINGTYYQYNNPHVCNSHYHLKCIYCGHLFHVDCEALQKTEEHLEEFHDFHVDKTKTIIYGTCKKCITSNGGSFQ